MALMAKSFSVLKKFWREILILFLFATCFTAMRSCKKQQSLAQLNAHGADSAYHYATDVTLKNGEHVFRIKTLEATVQQLKGSDIISELDKIKLKEQIGNLNRMVSYYSGKLTMDRTFASGGIDTVMVTVHDKDTVKIKEKSFRWQNSWLSINSIYNPLTDSIKHRYLYRVEFNMTSYRKGQNLFKRGQLVSDITFADPAIRIGEFQGIIVKEAPKRFYETTGFKVLAGIAIGVIITR